MNNITQYGGRRDCTKWMCASDLRQLRVVTAMNEMNDTPQHGLQAAAAAHGEGEGRGRGGGEKTRVDTFLFASSLAL